MSRKKLSKIENNELNRIIDVLFNKTSFQLYSTLQMYSKLSLTEFSRILKKSKSTIISNLGGLIEVGIVEGPIKEKIVSLKSGKANWENFYKLTDNYEDKVGNIGFPFDITEGFTEASAKRYIEMQNFMMNIQNSNLDIERKFVNKMNRNLDQKENIETELEVLDGIVHAKRDNSGNPIAGENGEKEFESETFFSINYVTKSQFEIIRKKLIEVLGNLDKQFEEEKAKYLGEEKSILVSIRATSMKRMLEYVNLE